MVLYEFINLDKEIFAKYLLIYVAVARAWHPLLQALRCEGRHGKHPSEGIPLSSFLGSRKARRKQDLEGS